jgi:hypothetical protein
MPSSLSMPSCRLLVVSTGHSTIPAVEASVASVLPRAVGASGSHLLVFFLYTCTLSSPALSSCRVLSSFNSHLFRFRHSCDRRCSFFVVDHIWCRAPHLVTLASTGYSPALLPCNRCHRCNRCPATDRLFCPGTPAVDVAILCNQLPLVSVRLSRYPLNSFHTMFSLSHGSWCWLDCSLVTLGIFEWTSLTRY